MISVWYNLVVGMITIRYGEERPGLGWHAHGTTSKIVWVLELPRLRPVLLHKQRWLHVASGTTHHDRPTWDTPGSPYGLDVIFLLVNVWLMSGCGLHQVDWPWNTERPARRTIQRHVRRLVPEAQRWEQAIRTALIEHVAPRPLEDFLPAGGIPPPKGRSSLVSASAWQLYDGSWLIKEVAQSLSITIRSLLVVARRRWQKAQQAPA